MTNVQIIRENKHAVTLLDGNRENRGGFSGPAEIIDGLMQMQEEARLYRVCLHDPATTATIPLKSLEDLDLTYRKAIGDKGSAREDEYLRGYYNGIILAHATIFGHHFSPIPAPVKGTGTDRGAAEAVAASVEQVSDLDNISVPFEVWLEMGAICAAAQKVADKPNGVVGLPALKELTDALNTLNARQEEDERKAIDRINDQLAAEEAPTAGPENSVSIEELPYPELVMLLQSEQITVERYVEEMERREAAWVEQMQADAERHRAQTRRFWVFQF